MNHAPSSAGSDATFRTVGGPRGGGDGNDPNTNSSKEKVIVGAAKPPAHKKVKLKQKVVVVRRRTKKVTARVARHDHMFTSMFARLSRSMTKCQGCRYDQSTCKYVGVNTCMTMIIVHAF